MGKRERVSVRVVMWCGVLWCGYIVVWCGVLCYAVCAVAFSHLRIKTWKNVSHVTQYRYESSPTFYCYSGDFWEPRKRDPDLTESGFRGLDVLALLVSIYGEIENKIGTRRI